MKMKRVNEKEKRYKTNGKGREGRGYRKEGKEEGIERKGRKRVKKKREGKG